LFLEKIIAIDTVKGKIILSEVRKDRIALVS
jgi:hypothetical protein